MNKIKQTFSNLFYGSYLLQTICIDTYFPFQLRHHQLKFWITSITRKLKLEKIKNLIWNVESRIPNQQLKLCGIEGTSRLIYVSKTVKMHNFLFKRPSDKVIGWLFNKGTRKVVSLLVAASANVGNSADYLRTKILKRLLNNYKNLHIIF